MFGLDSGEAMQVLRRSRDFAGCPRRDLRALANAGTVFTVPAEWVFVHEGTPSDACYVLLSGRARVLVNGEQRATLGPGDVAGEMALLGKSLRRGTIVASTRIRALRIENDALAAVMRQRPSIAEALSAVYDRHSD